MDYYETEICFKAAFKVLIFAENSDFLQKFLLDYWNWSECILKPKCLFSCMASNTCRNFWEAKLGKFGQLRLLSWKIIKKSTKIEKWWFLTILKIGSFLKFFYPQLQIFKNTSWAVEISANLKNEEITTLGLQKHS